MRKFIPSRPGEQSDDWRTRAIEPADSEVERRARDKFKAAIHRRKLEVHNRRVVAKQEIARIMAMMARGAKRDGLADLALIMQQAERAVSGSGTE